MRGVVKILLPLGLITGLALRAVAALPNFKELVYIGVNQIPRTNAESKIYLDSKSIQKRGIKTFYQEWSVLRDRKKQIDIIINHSYSYVDCNKWEITTYKGEAFDLSGKFLFNNKTKRIIEPEPNSSDDKILQIICKK